MEENYSATPLWQSTFIEVAETAGMLELFPAVWSAAEGLTSPEVKVRAAALDRLLEVSAARLSPLVAYLLATRIADPDVPLRCRVVRLLREILTPDERGHLAPDAVRRHLSGYLTSMRTRSIYCLLEAAVAEPDIEPSVASILNACPYAGNHLVELLFDRHVPLPLRQQAACLIGKVGYLEAIPALERLSARLEARLGGQQSMPFAPPSGQDELQLLPPIREALRLLRIP
jgi:HEAT repeat protein